MRGFTPPPRLTPNRQGGPQGRWIYLGAIFWVSPWGDSPTENAKSAEGDEVDRDAYIHSGADGRGTGGMIQCKHPPPEHYQWRSENY